MAIHYRACNENGQTFDSVDHTVRFSGEIPRTIKTSPRNPDMRDDGLVCFASGEDPGHEGFGQWFMKPGDETPTLIPGTTWRSWWTGRFAPSGKYYFGGKGTRTLFYKWSPETGLEGPYATGTSNIEGIADFQPVVNAQGEVVDWKPVWLDRGKPITVDGYRLPLWFRVGKWLFGMQGSEAGDRSVAKDPQGRWWEVTTKTSPVFISSAAVQENESLTVAWNGSAPGVTWPNSKDTGDKAWKPLPSNNQPIPPDPNPEPEPVVETQTKYPRPIFFAPYDSYAKPQYGNTDRPIGNVAFPWLDSMADTKPLPIIVGFDTYVPAEINRTIYYYIHANGSDAGNGWESAKKQWDVLKTKPERPVILYFDGRNWPADLPDWLPRDRAFLGVQAYPEKAETPAQFEKAMGDLCKVVSKFGLPLVLTPCFYNRNGQLTLDQIRDVMYVYDELVFDYKVIGIMPFSDMRTGQGMAAFPELYDDAQRMFNAIPARPNRYTYWSPSDAQTAKQALKDQVRYEISGFSKKQADKLCQLIDDHYTEDD